MVDEPGRNTTSTPHKEKKAKEIALGIAKNLTLPDTAVKRKQSWKRGWYVVVPNDGKWVINAEPVTIEVNTTPRPVNGLVAVARPIFRATKDAGLVPYVNPAAERSGMGHFHVGAAQIGESPFFKHPLLLRNVMVYLHKNPGLLHGFAEAFDIGNGSNIETYHDERQELFRDAVAEFDRWYDGASKAERANGFNEFISILHAYDEKTSTRVGFFEHYRLFNIRNLAAGNFLPDSTGKLTVEFRNFRPPKSPETAKSIAELLLALMEAQSAPNVKEKFEWISADEYLRFNTGTRVLSNWEKVKQDLDLNDPLLDAEVAEYAEAVQRFKYKSPVGGGELFMSHSRKDEKGEFFELRLSVSEHAARPELVHWNGTVDFERMSLDGVEYWVAAIDAKAIGVQPSALKEGRVTWKIRPSPGSCPKLFRSAG